MTNVFVQNLCFYHARFSIQSLFKTTPCPLNRLPENHTGVLASDSSHEYTVDRRSSSREHWKWLWCFGVLPLTAKDIYAKVTHNKVRRCINICHTEIYMHNTTFNVQQFDAESQFMFC